MGPDRATGRIRRLVAIVDLDGDGLRATEHVSLPFLRVPEVGEVRLSDLGDLLAALRGDLPADERPFVQVRLSRRGLGAGVREEVDRSADLFPIRLVDLRVAPSPDAGPASTTGDANVRLAALDPTYPLG